MSIVRGVLPETRDQARLNLLVRAGDIFHQSLDVAETLNNVARLSVESFADFCIFDLLDERSDRLFVTAAAHRDPRKDETLAGVLAEYEDAAKHTDELVATLPSLDADHPLPPAPWNPPGERWSARRTLLHIATETAQHAGHADIIRESIDGAKSMG